MNVLEHDWFPRPLPPQIEVGERTWLHSSYAFLHNRGRVRIGDDCGIYAGTQFELGPDAEVDIADFCTIVGAIIVTNGRVSIGDHTFIAHEVVIADTPFAVPPTEGRVWGPPSAAPVGCGAAGPLSEAPAPSAPSPRLPGGPVRSGVATRRAWTPGETGPMDAERSEAPDPERASSAIEIGAGAWIGARAILLAAARIGRDAVVGAGAVVTGEVPSGATAVGNPMRIVSR